jgi:GNAT superfamily N-acetyltransferase
VRREILPGYELDDDRGRMDAAAIHRYLSEEAYWSLGRSRETVDRILQTSHRVVGLFHEGRQVGFCRAISDGAVHAYLADVYVLEEHRGKGLGEAMVREMLDHGELAQVRWLLHTRDMQRLYHKLGFDRPSERLMERPGAPAPGAAQPSQG